MSNPDPNPKTRFRAGNTLGGRPKGSRDRLIKAFIDALAEDFEKHGAAAIEHVAQNQPLDFLKLVASLTPKALDVRADHMATHISEALSATDKWVEELVERFEAGEGKKPLPN